MRLSRADLLALLIALGAAITGVVVWNHGTVDLGMTLQVSDGSEVGLEVPLAGPVVTVHDVTPGGNADRNGFSPGMMIIDLTTTDGSEVERGEPLEGIESGSFIDGYWEILGPGYEVGTDGFRLPIEAVEPTRIAGAVGGWVDPQAGWMDVSAAIDRTLVEFDLDQSIWIAGLGLLFAAVVWRVLAHGLAGPFGSEHALVVAAAVAVPGLVLPAVQVGTPAGIAAGFLVPAAVALVLGLSLARHHPEPQWIQTAMAASLVMAALAAAVVVRYLTAQSLSGDDRGMILLLIAGIGGAPAAVAALARARVPRERASLLSLGLVPVAAATLIGPMGFQPIWPFVFVAILIGWYVLPFERAFALIGGGMSRVRSTAPSGSPAPTDHAVVVREPIVSAAFRDALTITLFGLVVVFGLFRQGSGAFVVLGVMLAGIVGFAIRSGILGEHWADAAIPLGVSVGLPVSVAGFEAWTYGGAMGWVSTAFALVGLSVAHVLATRHSDPIMGRSLVLWSVAVAAVSMVMWSVWGSGGNEPWAFVVACMVPLVPGLPVAFAADHDEPRAISTRLETLVVALTLGISGLVLTPLAWVPLVAWFIAIVVWRRFTLAPLLGLAQRTQLQRDLAVAAAETERARLAADLHDDALQQLTMLVRTLDEGGQKEAADEAREVATKLRSIVGDLRLPILDDLGAGAALEWLVERVEPLAGGPVKLERSDETRPPANVELAVFRVAQEALTNAIKHGKPPIEVRYDVRTDGRVTLAIDDAGEGIASEAAEEAPRQGHFGLANMQQRAEQIGALLDVRRWPAGGTRVALEWRPQ
jgi:signal transduction histidine kinase